MIKNKITQTLRPIKYLPKILRDFSKNSKDLFANLVNLLTDAKQKVIKDYKNTKSILSGKEKISYNNFMIGRKMLKEGNLLDAQFRFFLADTFYNKSAVIKYYRAYIYYIERKYTKSLKFLKQSIYIKPKMKESLILFQKIEKKLSKNLQTVKE